MTSSSSQLGARMEMDIDGRGTYCKAPQVRRGGPPGKRRRLGGGKPYKPKCLVIYTKPLLIIFLFRGSVEH